MKDIMTNHPNPHLDAALRSLREQTLTLDTPPAVEDTLLAAFAQQHPPPKKARWLQRLALPGWHAGSGLASLGGAVLAIMLVLALPADRHVPARNASLDDSGDFFALVDAAHIAQEPAPQLVETNVTRNSLAGLGVSLSPDNAGDLVRAQFLIGADGQPLALRLLPALSTQPDRG